VHTYKCREGGKGKNVLVKEKRRRDSPRGLFWKRGERDDPKGGEKGVSAGGAWVDLGGRDRRLSWQGKKRGKKRGVLV